MLEVGFKLKNAFLRENRSNNLAFTCMFSAVTRAKYARGECIVEIGLESTVITVNGIQGFRIGDGDVIGSDADDGAYLLFQSAESKHVEMAYHISRGFF